MHKVLYAQMPQCAVTVDVCLEGRCVRVLHGKLNLNCGSISAIARSRTVMASIIYTH